MSPWSPRALTQLIIVEVHTVRQLRIALPRARLLQENRQVLEYRVFYLAHVLSPHPVLGCAPQKALVAISIGGIPRGAVVPEGRVDCREPHNDVGVVTAHPRLVVHAVDIELLTGMGGGIFVMLFEDLVEACV